MDQRNLLVDTILNEETKRFDGRQIILIKNIKLPSIQCKFFTCEDSNKFFQKIKKYQLLVNLFKDFQKKVIFTKILKSPEFHKNSFTPKSARKNGSTRKNFCEIFDIVNVDKKKLI